MNWIKRLDQRICGWIDHIEDKQGKCIYCGEWQMMNKEEFELFSEGVLKNIYYGNKAAAERLVNNPDYKYPEFDEWKEKKRKPLKIVDRSRLKLVAIPKPGEDPERQKRDKKRKTARKKKSKLQKKKDNSNSTLWKRKADKAWGEYQHLTKKTCIVGQIIGDCNGPNNAHHLLTRANVFLRHEIENCAILCAFHHNFSPTCSPHAGPIGFVKLLQEHYPDKYQWVIDNQFKTGKPNYKEAYEHLNQLIKEHKGKA